MTIEFADLDSPPEHFLWILASRLPHDGPMRTPALVLAVIISGLGLGSLGIGLYRSVNRHLGLEEPPRAGARRARPRAGATTPRRRPKSNRH
jgi:hypothetical protein